MKPAVIQRSPDHLFHRALILAAGRGSRMGELTDATPKCLCPLVGRPLLDWTLDALRANGIDDVMVIGGWQHQRLAPWARQVRINPRWSESNMVRSLQCADDWLQQAPTLVLYGDGAYGRDAIASSLSGPAWDVVVPVDLEWRSLWERRFETPLLDAESLTWEGHQLTGIGQRVDRLDAIQGQFMGLLRLTPTGWSRISSWLKQHESRAGTSAVDGLDMTGMLHRMLNGGEPLHWVAVHGGWVEIDSPMDCSVIESAIDTEGFRHDFRC